MNPTTADYERLARLFQLGRTGEDDGWEDLALDEDNSECEPTRDTLDNFREAAKKIWRETSETREIAGGLYWESVQCRKGDRRVSVAVIDCGDFRLTYKQ